MKKVYAKRMYERDGWSPLLIAEHLLHEINGVERSVMSEIVAALRATLRSVKQCKRGDWSKQHIARLHEFYGKDGFPKGRAKK